MKYKLGIAAMALLILAAFLLINGVKKMEVSQRAGLRTEIFSGNGGYGYRIWARERLLLQQGFIPGISGNLPFRSPKEAQKVADFVKTRLEEHKDPRVLKADLEKMAINIPTLDR
ncbi:MAG: DUF4907 domain-containing protein [Sediminicola sp.]|tara:strand:- start:27902 stop:28246 length:345 start_codon:yes stop_codon:yes gene_type:complete